MGTKVLEYIKGLCNDGLPPIEWGLTPEYAVVLTDALKLTEEFDTDRVTFQNLGYYIDRQNAIGEVDDETLIKRIMSHEKYSPDFINVEFLAQIMDSPDFPAMMRDENARTKIFEQYSRLIGAIADTDPDIVTMQSENIMTLAEHCNDETKRTEILKLVQDKIDEVKRNAENIRELRDLMKFRAIRFNEYHLKRNLRFVLENVMSVWGKNNGALIADTFQSMYDEGGNDQEKQMVLDSLILAFDSKIMALRKAWGIAENEARHNFMVEV
jgi:hypothetical protein